MRDKKKYRLYMFYSFLFSTGLFLFFMFRVLDYYYPDGKGKIEKIEQDGKSYYALLDNKHYLFIGRNDIKAGPGDTINKDMYSFVYVVNNKNISVLRIEAFYSFCNAFILFFASFLFVTVNYYTGICEQSPPPEGNNSKS